MINIKILTKEELIKILKPLRGTVFPCGYLTSKIKSMGYTHHNLGHQKRFPITPIDGWMSIEYHLGLFKNLVEKHYTHTHKVKGFPTVYYLIKSD